MAKGTANNVIRLTNLVDDVINTVAGTNLQYPEFTASSAGEKQAMVGTSIGLALIPGADEAEGIKLTSSIDKDSALVKYAEQAGKSVQKSLDNLVEQLGRGNMDPGIGTKSLGSGISYARARDGARVFFRAADNEVEILAKASKANEQQVIARLKQLY